MPNPFRPHSDITLERARELVRELRVTRRALRSEPAPRGESRINVARVTTLESELEALCAQPGVRAELTAALTQRARVLRAAAQVHLADLRAETLEQQGETLYGHAARARRPLTPAEYQQLEELRKRAEAERASALDRAVEKFDQTAREELLEALGRLRIRAAQRQLQAGLLLTDQMRDVIRESLTALFSGSPILLIGETGGAKTALAEYLARTVLGREAEFVSGYGDITSAQLVGSHELRVKDGATVTAFEPGPLLRAMRDGRPLILDEVNAMPPEFLKRLNRILQLRPGAVVPVQEQAGLSVTIAPGFLVIATANEHAPLRYRGVEPLSADLVNRFGAHTYRIHYPDAGLDFTDFPQENALLAAAALADDRGELPGGITAEQVTRVARVAFISQQVFSGNYGEGFDRYVTTDRDYDEQPGLEEAVIAPRTLGAILEKVALQAQPGALERALNRFVEGVMHRGDRRVLRLILEGQGFR